MRKTLATLIAIFGFATTANAVESMKYIASAPDGSCNPGDVPTVVYWGCPTLLAFFARGWGFFFATRLRFKVLA